MFVHPKTANLLLSVTAHGLHNADLSTVGLEFGLKYRIKFYVDHDRSYYSINGKMIEGLSFDLKPVMAIDKGTLMFSNFFYL